MLWWYRYFYMGADSSNKYQGEISVAYVLNDTSVFGHVETTEAVGRRMVFLSCSINSIIVCMIYCHRKFNYYMQKYGNIWEHSWLLTRIKMHYMITCLCKAERKMRMKQVQYYVSQRDMEGSIEIRNFFYSLLQKAEFYSFKRGLSMSRPLLHASRY